MKRLLLVHWNESEARERAGRLRKAGYRVGIHADAGGGKALRAVRDRPPDAFVIDLGRLPSHGRAVAEYFRQSKATRGVPVVFVGGDREKVGRIREALPDAVYTEWPRVRGAITRALKHPPAEPIVPQSLSGYSGTPLPKKLGIKAGSTVALMAAPDDLDRTLGKLPDGVSVTRREKARADMVMLFARSCADLERRFDAAVRRMADGGSLWIAWPKKAAGTGTDLSQQIVRDTGLAAGLVDFKICSIDETWSPLRFSPRR